MKTDDLVGRWRKVEDDSASPDFPHEVEFHRDRTYQASHHGRLHAVWDQASFDVMDDGTLRIETATDRKVRYPAALNGDELTLESPAGTVTYRRCT